MVSEWGCLQVSDKFVIYRFNLRINVIIAYHIILLLKPRLYFLNHMYVILILVNEREREFNRGTRAITRIFFLEIRDPKCAEYVLKSQVTLELIPISQVILVIQNGHLVVVKQQSKPNKTHTKTPHIHVHIYYFHVHIPREIPWQMSGVDQISD